CLLEVVAQKSSRSIISVSRATLPSSATIVVLLFLPKGGFVITISYRSPESPAKESATTSGSSSPPMPCSIMFIAHKRAVLWTSSQPRKADFFRSQMILLRPNERERFDGACLLLTQYSLLLPIRQAAHWSSSESNS